MVYLSISCHREVPLTVCLSIAEHELVNVHITLASVCHCRTCDECQAWLRPSCDQQARQMRNVPSCAHTPAVTSDTSSCPIYRCTAGSTLVSDGIEWRASCYGGQGILKQHEVQEMFYQRRGRETLLVEGCVCSVIWAAPLSDAEDCESIEVKHRAVLRASQSPPSLSYCYRAAFGAVIFIFIF